ncbi:MAG: hypothetical protein RL425_1044 [Pseudomonadota bacterium]|jgi:hypothetical protein
MTNMLLLLLLGGVLGWAVTALHRDFQATEALTNILVGSVISFIAALITNGGTLFGGLSAYAYGAAAGSALLSLGLLRWASPFGRRSGP